MRMCHKPEITMNPIAWSKAKMKKSRKKNLWEDTYFSLGRQMLDHIPAKGINVYHRRIFEQQVLPDIPQTNIRNEISIPTSQSEIN